MKENIEVAHINIKDIGEDSLFPKEKFDIRIQSNDSNPPHLYVLSDDWNIAFEIETGMLMKVISESSDKSVYNFINKNIVRWLDSQSSLIPEITNRENAMAQWIQLHS